MMRAAIELASLSLQPFAAKSAVNRSRSVVLIDAAGLALATSWRLRELQ
jgi:hypothetical protein